MKIETTNVRPEIEIVRRHGRYPSIIKDFLTSPEKYLLLTLDSVGEYNSARNSLYVCINRHHWKEKVAVHGSANAQQIYLEKLQ